MSTMEKGLLVLCVSFILLAQVRPDISQPTDCPGEFGACLCTWGQEESIPHVTEMNCTNAGFETDNVLSYVVTKLPRLQTLIFTGNDLGELGVNVFGDCYNYPPLTDLTYVDLSNNEIKLIHGQSFHCVPRLNTLKLNNNKWMADPNKARVFSSLPHLQVLHLENAFMQDPGMSHMINLTQIFRYSYLKYLNELHLDNNGIAYMNSEAFCDLPNMKKLYLTGNELTKINLLCLSYLQELYIADNKIPYLIQSDLNIVTNWTDLSVLDISNNPLQCTDCTNSGPNFIHWIQSSGYCIKDINALKCTTPAALADTKLMDVTDAMIKGSCKLKSPASPHRSNAFGITAGVVFGIIGLMTVTCMVINRKSIKKKMGSWTKPLRESIIVGRLSQKFSYGYTTMDESVNEEINA